MKFMKAVYMLLALVPLYSTQVYADEVEIEVPAFVKSELTAGQKLVTDIILEVSLPDGFIQVKDLMINLTDQRYVKDRKGKYILKKNAVLREGATVAVVYTEKNKQFGIYQADKVFVLKDVSEAEMENRSEQTTARPKTTTKKDSIKFEDGVWKN